MLNIKNKKLTVESVNISNADTLLYLTTDIDCSLIGVLRFVTGEQKVVTFVKANDRYQARLVITSDDIKHLKTSKFYVIMISGSLNQQTNEVELEFNIELIKQSIKIATSNEILELKKELIKLENKINSVTGNGIIKNIDIKNKNAIKKGMIPVAIDDNGNFVCMYPFEDFAKVINGQQATNGCVTIDSSMIKYDNGKTISEIITAQITTFTEMGKSFELLSEQLQSLNTRLGELGTRVEAHINNGII